MATLTVFFVFFYEDYYSLQKYVRGIVVVYYTTILLELWWPHELALLVALIVFQTAFIIWYRIIFRIYLAPALILVLIGALWLERESVDSPGAFMLPLVVAAIVYLHTFISAAYDIRRTAAVGSR